MRASLFRHFLAFLALALAFPALSQAETVYKFGVVPQFEPRQLSAVWSPILTELEKRTGFKFLMVGSPRIPEFEAEIQAGRYDFAYMNPYHAVVAHSTQKYEPIVREGAEQLFGIGARLAFEAAAEAVGIGVERAAFAGDRAATVFDAALPDGRTGSLHRQVPCWSRRPADFPAAGRTLYLKTRSTRDEFHGRTTTKK